MSEERFILPDHVDPEFPFWVVIEEDESIMINWDPNHPITSIFNDWTPEQFIRMLKDQAEQTIEEHTKETA